ncbi:MAG: UvrD-helicase domain-containing protein, partial [Halioglobus sp.]
FCVSAPAGSGKTELLIQRYLRLLARVERPEQILAITFTIKAAAEMRERVREAIEAARDDLPIASEHEQTTRDLAKAALAADKARGWHLLRDVSRFNIKTIDSFCAGLTRQMPVLSQLGGQLAIEDDVLPLYEEAVVTLFGEIDGSQPFTQDLEALMLHFDNDWERLKDRLVSMLGSREQWQSYVGVHYDPDESERHLVTTVEGIVSDKLEALEAILSPYETDLLVLENYAALNLGLEPLELFPSAVPSALPHWQRLVSMLLTAGGTWRKTITKTNGFPKDGEQAVERKDALKALLADLQQIPALDEKLAEVTILPRIKRDSKSWKLVLHLSRLLPMLAAQLLLVFSQRQSVDYAQISQSALIALGDDDQPTDLALRLDYRIEHILVDEFQDTAVTQFELLQKLTRGWGEHNAQQPNSPRTLFIVGDGMQSIYAFRGANVGLLVKAQQDGFNGVALEPLQLTSNFRSDEGVVNWVNEVFSQAFPAYNNANLAQVKFSAATAVRPPSGDVAVRTEFFTGEGDRDAEVEYLCSSIAARLTESPEESIAILGRSRSQLQPIIRELKLRGVAFHAQDLDSLSTSPAIADLLVLSRVMSNAADRLAWMSALRAPWCGLSLADLYALTKGVDHARFATLWQLFEDGPTLQLLSADGLLRLESVRRVFLRARATRERLALRAWIEQLWEGLGGPATVVDELALEDVRHFMELLEEADAAGVGLDVNWLERKLEKRFMAGGSVDSPLQIMTMHKAKGLEFDHVLIPQVARTTKGDSREILLWDEYSDADGNRGFLLAADDREKEDPTLYNFLAARRKEKAQLENTRLLYVGATRAVKTLLITGCLATNAKDGSIRAPAKNSLLHSLWPAINAGVELRESVLPPAEPAVAAHKLIRMTTASMTTMPTTGSLQSCDSIRGDAAGGNQPERSVNSFERAVGTVVHLAMEQLSLLAELPDGVSTVHKLQWRMALQSHGLWGEELQKAESEVETAVVNVLSHEGKGRWVLSSAHPHARSEYAVSAVDSDGRLKELIVDRTFVDEKSGVRWVVDYKNSRPVGGQAVTVFMINEADTYRAQLQGYRDVLRLMDDRPIQCALFFTALGEFYPLPDLALP